MDIYIKPVKKALLAQRNKIVVSDICEVIATSDVTEKVNELKLLDIKSQDKKYLIVSVTDIVKAIKKVYPDATVNNLGEMDTVIEYAPERHKDSSWFKWFKIAFVSLVLFVGSSTAIMTFQTDSQLSKVFENYYYIFFKENTTEPRIIEIPYSIGLGAGIILFFNHFVGKKVSDDPTPIEVEMSLYSTEITDTMLEHLNNQKTREEDPNASS